MSALPRLADCPALAVPDRDLQILQVSVCGCTLHTAFQGDRFSSSDLDNAVWAALRARNFQPGEFKGWKVDVQAGVGKHTVAVKVY